MRHYLVAVAFIFASISTATAADQVAGTARFALYRATGKLVLSVRDPDIAVPAVGSADDPTIAGALLEVFATTDDVATTLPTGPAWRAIDGFRTRYLFRNRIAPERSLVRAAKLVDGVAIKIVALGVVFPDGPLGSVALRLTMQGTRICAVFAPEQVQRDDAVRFVGRATGDAGLTGCDDSALAVASCGGGAPVCGGNCLGGGACVADLGGGSCLCVQPSSPCGETAPVCNGACSEGEECVTIAGVSTLAPECVCIPEGATPCGTPGAPVCGGACPEGQVCEPIHQHPIAGGGVVCTCGAPDACKLGGLACGNGFACGNISLGEPTCLPIPCGGIYPTCGGGCGSGVCRALDINGTFLSCICADPDGAGCDTECGGFLCDEGLVCRVNLSPAASCGCEAP